MLSHFSHVWLCVIPWTAASQAPPSMGFSRQEYWSGLPCPPPGDLPIPGIQSMSLALASMSFITSATWKAQLSHKKKWNRIICNDVDEPSASQVALVVKNPPAYAGDGKDGGSIPGSGKTLRMSMATHSSVLNWRIPWAEEPGGLWPIGLQRVRHDWSELGWLQVWMNLESVLQSEVNQKEKNKYCILRHIYEI